MLLIVAAVGALVFALGLYLYGRTLENGRRYDYSRRQNLDRSLAATTSDSPRETWELVLFDCDFGASSQTHGPGRTLKISKKSQHWK